MTVIRRRISSIASQMRCNSSLTTIRPTSFRRWRVPIGLQREWRQPLSQWQARFARWVDNPDPTALMNGCTFFDCRHVYGDAVLTSTLRHSLLERTRGNRSFYPTWRRRTFAPATVGAFQKKFVLSGARDETRVLDLKHAGVVPNCGSCAGICARCRGVDAMNTRERLEAAVSSGELSQSGARDLGDALAFLSDTRFRHQTRQLEAGLDADDLVAPDSLSRFERGHLKEASLSCARCNVRLLSVSLADASA